MPTRPIPLRRPGGAALGAATLAVTLLAGCADDGGSTWTAPDPDDPAQSSEFGPVADVRTGGTDWVQARVRLEELQQEGAESCLADAGHDVDLPDPDPAELTTDGYELAYGTPLADPAFRGTHGYGVTSALVGLAPEPVTDDLTRYRDGLDDERADAFEDALSGCVEQARQDVLPADDLAELDDLTRDLYDEIWTDGRVSAGLDAWVECMQDAGYPVISTEQPPAELSGRAQPLYDADVAPDSPDAQALHAEELATAEADWTCQSEHVVPAYQEVKHEKEAELLAEHDDLAGRVHDAVRATLHDALDDAS
ncbi:hypothetical protein [Thalassiella azotivora]